MLSSECEFRARIRSIATLLEGERERKVTAGVILIVINNLPADPFREWPIVSVARRPADRFHGEERLHPVVGPRQRANLVDEVVECSVRTIALAAAQQILPLEFLKGWCDQRLATRCRSQLGECRIRLLGD